VPERPAGYPLPADAVPATRAAWAVAPGELMSPHYAGCFACGGDHPDGLHLSVVAAEGAAVVARCAITGAHQGAPGLAHGGIVAAVLDESQGFVVAVLGFAAVTGRLEISYRRPVPIGSEVVTHAWATGVAGRKVFTAATMTIDDNLVAEASGLFIQVGEAHFRPYLDRAVGSVAGVTADVVSGAMESRIGP
jgi:acyl-coenzyme A thioesterase PaaI-like protein